jgi:hypothetical protein
MTPLRVLSGRSRREDEHIRVIEEDIKLCFLAKDKIQLQDYEDCRIRTL